MPKHLFSRTFARIVSVFSLVAVSATFSFADNVAGRDISKRKEFATDLYFVAFKAGLTTENVAFAQSLGARLHRRFPAIRTASFRMGSAIAARLQNDSRVDYVEAVPMMYKADLSTEQLVPTATNGLFGLVRTYALQAQAAGATGANTNVGVADTGIDYTHPDISPNYRGGYDFVDDDFDPFWNFNAEETHSTHVSGTILAANNTQGVFGVAYNANLYLARVLGPDGSGSGADVMAGVQYLAEAAHCRVVNLSLGGGRRTQTEQNFYSQIHAMGTVVVAASGNDGSTRLSYPAGYDGVISVGAVDQNNVKADFSNAGVKLDLVGPGVNVLSSVPIGTGSEASVTAAGSTYLAFGMTFAAKTNGLTAILVNCGQALAATDCPANTAGNIAVIQRGTISFSDKVTNAMNAGAAGAVIYNNVPDIFGGTLGTPTTADGRPWVPAVTVSDTTGASLVAAAGTSGTLLNKISNWDYYSGTSMATPHVSGVVALILSVNPGIAVTTIEDILAKTAVPLGPKTSYGRGIVNAASAVSSAKNP